MATYAEGFHEKGWSKEDRKGTKRMLYECDKGHVSESRAGQGTEASPYKCPVCNKSEAERKKDDN